MRHGNETARRNTQGRDIAGHQIRGTTDRDRPGLHPTEAKRLSDRGIASETQAFLRARPHAICLTDVNNPDAGRKDSLSEVERRARPQRNKRKPVKSAVLDSGLAAAPCCAKVYKASQASAAVRERVREWLLSIEGNADKLRIRDTKPNALASVPEESTDSSEEEVLPFGPLRRLDSTPRLVSLPRSRSFERMMTNDRQPPPTPFSSLAKRGREGGRESKSLSSGNLFYAHVVAKSQSSGNLLRGI